MDKKLGILACLSFLIMALLMASCTHKDGGIKDVDDPEGANSVGQVKFGFDPSEISGMDSSSQQSVKAVLISVKDSSGNSVYELKKLSLYNMNGGYVSAPVSLGTGAYFLTECLVLDGGDNVLYAAPVEGSPKAYLVKAPLPIGFTVKKDKVATLKPEVLSVVGCKPGDFGYVSFGFEVVETLSFLVAVFVHEESHFVLTDAAVAVRSGEELLFSGKLEARTNVITVREGHPEYEIRVTKQGYRDYAETYSDTELKDLWASPLVVVLDERVTPSAIVKTGELQSRGIFGIDAGNDGRVYLAEGDHISVREAVTLREITQWQLPRKGYFREPLTVKLNPAGTRLAVSSTFYYPLTFIDTANGNIISQGEPTSWGDIAWLDNDTLALAMDYRLYKVDSLTGKVVGSGGLSGYSSGIAKSPTRNVVAVSSIFSELYFVNMDTMEVETTLSGSGSAADSGIEFSGDGSRLVVAGGTQLLVFDAISRSLLNSYPYGDGYTTGLYSDLVLSGNTAYVSLNGKGVNRVIAIDIVNGEKRDIGVGVYPCFMDLCPDKSALYVSNRLSQSISVVDVASLALTSHHHLPGIGTDLVDLRFSSDGKYMLTANWNNSSLSVHNTVVNEFFTIPAGRLSRGWGNPRCVTLAGSKLAFAGGEDGIFSVRLEDGSVVSQTDIHDVAGRLVADEKNGVLYAAHAFSPRVDSFHIDMGTGALSPSVSLSGWEGSQTIDLALNADATQLAICSSHPPRLTRYNLKDRSFTNHPVSGAQYNTTCVRFSGDGKRIYVGCDASGGYAISVFDVSTGSWVNTYPFSGAIWDMETLQSDFLILVTDRGYEDPCLILFDAAQGVIVDQEPLDKDYATNVELNPSDGGIAVGHFAGGVTFFKLVY
jgi:DNA-binding beta-propeller fold protein YncE